MIHYYLRNTTLLTSSLGKTPEMPTLPCPISEVQQYESIPSKPEQSVDTQIGFIII